VVRCPLSATSGEVASSKQGKKGLHYIHLLSYTNEHFSFCPHDSVKGRSKSVSWDDHFGSPQEAFRGLNHSRISDKVSFEMSFFCRLTRRHYWCTPHRSAADNRLVQVCYECGAERAVQELQNEISTEWIRHSIATAKAEMSNLAAQLSAERLGQRATSHNEPIAVGQNRRKFSVVK
jgi:hypothetical protein